jgi:glycosyltransferase involved in cell wall biosynthesis
MAMEASPKIGFIHPGKAFLPELESYKRFFNRIGFTTLELHPRESAGHSLTVEWHMMGTHWIKSSEKSVVIHEYASPSTPPFASLKNQMKRFFSCQPDFRLYLNEATRSEMGFTDSIPFGYRDMFIPDISTAYKKPEAAPLYDFVYAGSVTPDRKPERLLKHFSTGKLKGYRLLVLSKDYTWLQNKFHEYNNITFIGPVPQAELGHFFSQARFGIDYRPPIKPYDIQTSSKLLEYLAYKLPVICSSTTWLRSFQKNYGGRFFLLDEDLDNFSMEAIESFEFGSPDLSSWTFANQMDRSGVLPFLYQKTGLEQFNLTAKEINC